MYVHSIVVVGIPFPARSWLLALLPFAHLAPFAWICLGHGVSGWLVHLPALAVALLLALAHLRGILLLAWVGLIIATGWVGIWTGPRTGTGTGLAAG